MLMVFLLNLAIHLGEGVILINVLVQIIYFVNT